ncbi:energy transducer TonB [Lacihabitans soyangensis]|uniref:Energy transducer TonB n=1 Tax=Lacihabitans soyangensis TaxID=869394 RepID=A0AAE3H5U0_9BACT|nr:energy transducer TonB [Lacihabitans soyangensis]MCP9764579.1 energy transducer TonB [Lacihabitans soyangensis]
MSIKVYYFRKIKGSIFYCFVIFIFLFQSSQSNAQELVLLPTPGQEEIKVLPRFSNDKSEFLRLLQEKFLVTEKDINTNAFIDLKFTVGMDGSLSKFSSSNNSNSALIEQLISIIISLGSWHPAFNEKNIAVESTISIKIPLEVDEIFTAVEQNPEFMGGQKAMYNFINDNIKYPFEAQRNDISGRVFLKFVVEKDGSIGNVEVRQGLGYGCDEEAVRVIKLMPKWNPGSQNGKLVRVYYNMPVLFKKD